MKTTNPTTSNPLPSYPSHNEALHAFTNAERASKTAWETFVADASSPSKLAAWDSARLAFNLAFDTLVAVENGEPLPTNPND